MPIFALQTWAGTFAYYDPKSDRLRHAPAGHIRNVVTIQEQNGKYSFDFAPHDPVELLAHRLNRGEFTVWGEFPSALSIRVDGFLCSEATGTIVGNRQEISRWEIFTLVPIDRVRPLLGMDLDSQAVAIIGLPSSQRIPQTIHKIFISRIDSLKFSAQPPEPFQQSIIEMKAKNPGFLH
jgi:hypothetical protein